MDAIIEALASYGIAGIFLAVLVYYLEQITDIHREERKDWQVANDKHVEKVQRCNCGKYKGTCGDERRT
jgi:hypothetical protein